MRINWAVIRGTEELKETFNNAVVCFIDPEKFKVFSEVLKRLRKRNWKISFSINHWARNIIKYNSETKTIIIEISSHVIEYFRMKKSKRKDFKENIDIEFLEPLVKWYIGDEGQWAGLSDFIVRSNVKIKHCVEKKKKIISDVQSSMRDILDRYNELFDK